MSLMSPPDTKAALSLSHLRTQGVLPFLGCLYQQVDSLGMHDYACFVLDVNTREFRKISREIPPDSCYGSSGVVLGNRIYIFGGMHRLYIAKENNHVFYLDSDNFENDWVTAPQMTVKRSFPICALLDGKVYVLGNYSAEVFDSRKGMWAPLHRPMQEVSEPVLADSSLGRIFVHDVCTKSLYAYHINDDRWDCLAENYGEWSFHSVIADGVIYSLSPWEGNDNDMFCFSVTYSSLRAYDVHEEKHFSTKWLWSSDSEAMYVPLTAGFFHLDNNMFCLAWHCMADNAIKYIKFSVCKVRGEILAIAEPMTMVSCGFEVIADFSVFK